MNPVEPPPVTEAPSDDANGAPDRGSSARQRLSLLIATFGVNGTLVMPNDTAAPPGHPPGA